MSLSRLVKLAEHILEINDEYTEEELPNLFFVLAQEAREALKENAMIQMSVNIHPSGFSRGSIPDFIE